MNPKDVLTHARRLCDVIDAARPVRFGVRRVVMPLAIPAALGLGVGIAGCGASTSIEPFEEICDNGVDDDEDGLVDCDDEDCDAAEGCHAEDAGCEPRVEYCEDGIDNNGDGATDCEDLCCDAFCWERDCPMCTYGVPFEPLDAEATCDDGLDEDCDGLTECCDPDCDDDPLCAG